MGIAAQLKATKMSGGQRVYFKEGEHRCRVDSVILGKTPMSNVDMFAVEVTVMRTTSDDKSMQPGRVINSSTLRQGEQAKVYFPNIKAFIGGLYGFSDDDIDAMPDSDLDSILEKVTGKEQAATGLLVDASCVARPDGKVFPKWKQVPDEEQPLYQKQNGKTVAANA